jgi:hypothetical protein
VTRADVQLAVPLAVSVPATPIRIVEALRRNHNAVPRAGGLMAIER